METLRQIMQISFYVMGILFSGTISIVLLSALIKLIAGKGRKK